MVRKQYVLLRNERQRDLRFLAHDSQQGKVVVQLAIRMQIMHIVFIAKDLEYKSNI